MNTNPQNPFLDLSQTVLAYLPSLLAGVVLLFVGWAAGWIAKRIVIQLLVVLRFERFVRWRRELSKADIRYGLYNFLGNLVFLLVFLVFLYSALDVMKLAVLSQLIQNSVLFVPRLLLALVIFGVGWLLASRASRAVFSALIKENVPQYSLIARFIKFIVVLFFSAMALVELEIATQIVIIGFTTVIISICLLVIVLAVIGGRSFLDKFWNPTDKE